MADELENIQRYITPAFIIAADSIAIMIVWQG